jgi:CDP-paratose 2-epimerase
VLKYLVTGGAGFIGCNYASRLIARGEQVTVLDNLSRRGAASNLKWLQDTYGEHAFDVCIANVRDLAATCRAAKDVDVIVHLAGQTAVTTSVLDPVSDFEDNALGTLHALEAARGSGSDPVFLFASTNKVYGGMEDAAIVEGQTRYEYRDLPEGVSEAQPLDFHSPYGCSKGAADQYVRDYARIYGLRTVVFRQSCIYGPRQMGVEDQGWLAWFMIAAVTGQPIRIYGDGKQVRDVLFVEDLLDAYDAAVERADVAAGEVFNIGGGPSHTISVWCEFAPILDRFLGRSVHAGLHEWRAGDQRVYVSDVRRARQVLGWAPTVSCDEGLRRLFDWVCANRELFE